MNKRLTQRQRLLRLLRQRGKVGVKVWEIMTPRPHGLGIAQYGARILELRRRGYIIENKVGLFVLVKDVDIPAIEAEQKHFF